MLPVDVVIANLRTLGALDLARRTAAEQRVRLRVLLSHDRHRAAAAARRRFWALLRWNLGLSYPEIGASLGFDHTTILSGVRKREIELSRQAGPGIVAVNRHVAEPEKGAA